MRGVIKMSEHPEPHAPHGVTHQLRSEFRPISGSELFRKRRDTPAERAGRGLRRGRVLVQRQAGVRRNRRHVTSQPGV